MNIYDGYGNIIEISDAGGSGKNVLSKKNVIILADSVFDYEQPDGINIGQMLAVSSGATVYNWAQGGCCMAKGKATNYDPYSFVGMVDALTSGDFTDQIANAEERGFTTQVAEMQAFNMANCDYMLVAYGTNDFWRSCLYDNPSDDEDVTYFSGAVRYGIKTLLTTYPSIKLIFLNLQNMGSIYNETAAWYNATGSHYVESSRYNGYINDICAEFAVPVLDIWNESLINNQTKTIYNDPGGMPHLSHKGKQKYVTMIENAFNHYY